MEQTAERFAARTAMHSLGNAIALPCAEYIMAGIAEVMG